MCNIVVKQVMIRLWKLNLMRLLLYLIMIIDMHKVASCFAQVLRITDSNRLMDLHKHQKEHNNR